MNWRGACVAAATTLFACVPAPEDPVSYGVLCQPATDDCPNVTLIERDVVGRNQVDYIVRNNADVLATAEVIALVPGADFSAANIAPEDLIARREHEAISPGEPAENRFTPTDLGVRETFQLGVQCSGCDVEVEFVHTTVPRECYEEDDCPATWQCDDTAGRCVECLVNADCSSDQRCNLQTGRCDPPDTTKGCATVSSDPTLFALLLLGLLAARTRRRHHLALLFVLMLTPDLAAAAPPRASIAVAGGPRIMFGKLGPLTKRGVGIAIQQELRWRYVGAGISLGTSYYLTTQDPPPFSRSLQTYGVAIGPRLYLPISFFELVAGGDYRRLGTANNSLIRVTGERRSFDAVGGMVGGRIRWSGLELRLEATAHQILQLDTTQFGVDLGFGFTNSQ